MGAFLAEAAAYRLEGAGHALGVELQHRGFRERKFRISWPSPLPEHADAAYADQQDTTEDAAVAVAVAAVEQILEGKTCIERSIKGTAYDYWLGKDDPLPFQQKEGLEVSGIAAGDQSKITDRCGEKRRRLQNLKSHASGYIFVVEFSEPSSKMELVLAKP